MVGVARHSQQNSAYPIGHAYIILPDNISRQDYLDTCYSKERVSITGADGTGLFKDCPVLTHVMQNIEFPQTSNDLGSLVIYINEPFHNKPIIVGVASKERESQLLSEGKFEIIKELGNNSVSVTGDAENGSLSINVDSTENSQFTINVTGNDSARFVINCGNRAEINANEQVSMNSSNQIRLQTQTPSRVEEITSRIDVNRNDVNIVPNETFNVFGGTEPIPLGDTLQSLLETLLSNQNLIIDAITNGVPVAQDGGLAYQESMVLILQAIQSVDFSGMNSQKAFIE